MKKILPAAAIIIILSILPCSYLFAGSISDINDYQGPAIRNSESVLLAQADISSSHSDMDDGSFDDDFIDDLDDFEEPHESIADPLEPFNRAMYHFNDKLYLWVLNPAAKGYSAVVPQPARKGIKNFFKNISFPVRFVNCIFQGKFKGAGIEIDRFLINSTIGIAGFMDIAANKFDLNEHDEDFGQTLGSHGIGHGFFINWPFLGPSSVTDTVGSVGDAFLEPLNYVDMETKYKLALRGFKLVNKTSLRLGEYEDLKKASLDPYVALRDAYYQYRQSEIKK